MGKKLQHQMLVRRASNLLRIHWQKRTKGNFFCRIILLCCVDVILFNRKIIRFCERCLSWACFVFINTSCNASTQEPTATMTLNPLSTWQNFNFNDILLCVVCTLLASSWQSSTSSSNLETIANAHMFLGRTYFHVGSTSSCLYLFNVNKKQFGCWLSEYFQLTK